jgi:hypothetical protein
MPVHSKIFQMLAAVLQGVDGDHCDESRNGKSKDQFHVCSYPASAGIKRAGALST